MGKPHVDAPAYAAGYEVGLSDDDPEDVYGSARERFEAVLGHPPRSDGELGEWWLGYHHGRTERRRKPERQDP